MSTTRVTLGRWPRLFGMNRSLQTCSLVLCVGLMACASLPNIPARDGDSSTGASVVDPQVEHGHALLQGSGSLQLFHQWWRPVGTPPRAVVVVVHGLKDHGSRYEELARRLVTHDFAVYALDLRGHAHSEGARVDIGTFDDYVNDVEVVIQEAQRREPGKPVFLFGHSMGGAIVTRYTQRHPGRLQGLITHAAALKVDLSGPKVASIKALSALNPRAGLFQLELDAFSRDPQVVAAARADPLIHQPAAPVHTARELLLALEDIHARMETLTLPLLVLHGTADTVTSPEGSQELYRRAGSSDKTLKLYKGLFHDLVHEPEKETVLVDITTWLDAHVPPAAK